MRIALATCATVPDWEVDDRPLVRALLERGADVVQPAWGDPDVDWSSHDACLIRTTWDYQEHCTEYLAWAERAGAAAPLFNPAAVVRWNTHKQYLRELEALGVRIAPTEWLERGQDVDVAAVLAARGWERAFVKPCVGATARETLRFAADADGIAQAQAHLERLLLEEDLLLQPYLASVETEGELSVLFVDGEPTHGVQKLPVAGDYRVQDDFGALDRPYEFEPGELDLARSIVAPVEDRFGGTLLYARVDFLRADDGGLLLNELELVEPSLFLRHGPGAAARLAESLLARL